MACRKVTLSPGSPSNTQVPNCWWGSSARGPMTAIDFRSFWASGRMFPSFFNMTTLWSAALCAVASAC